MQRMNVGSGARWEDIVGYSRAVRVGPYVEVAGTTAVDADGNVVGRGDAYAQARFIFGRIDDALRRVGARLEDVVRTRMFVTDIGRWPEIGRAHGEVFGGIRPVATMVEVRSLIDPELMVEIEVTAIVHED